VIGFNSTVLIEAGLLGRPVVMPLLGEARDRYLHSNVYFLKYAEDAFIVPRTSEEFLRAIQKGTRSGSTTKEIPSEMVDDYFGFFDGGVSNRVVSEMIGEVRKAQRNYRAT